MTVMYDAANAQNIPADATLVAGYINGRYRWSEADWARFPNARRVRIAIYIPGGLATPLDGDVLDVEAGDAPGARQFAAAWVDARRKAGIVPTIYTSKSGMLYLGGLPCDYWLADPSPAPHVLPGTVATQWHYPGPYDVSETADFWPRTKDDPMPNAPLVAVRLTKSGNGYWLFGSDGGVFAYGDAGFFDSVPGKGIHLNNPIVSVDVTASERGYLMASGDYSVFAFGDAPFLGHP